VLDVADPKGQTQLVQLRKQWPAALLVCVSDSGLAGESVHRIDRANLYVNLRPVIEAALKDSAIAQGQLPDHRLVPSVRAGKPNIHLSVLVVDDSTSVRQQVVGSLDRIGFSAEEATNGEMALNKAKLKIYDLYLLDIDMPGMDGYTVAKRLHDFTDRPKASIIILSSRSSPFDRVRGALSGCDSYLVKPIHLKDLYAAVDAAMLKSTGGDRDVLIAKGYRIKP
jgi:CheY-like chemotaxis protein